jgi:hypothetical protein
MSRSRGWKGALASIAVIAATGSSADAQIVFDGNILHDNTADYATDAAGTGPCYATEKALAETVFTRNVTTTNSGAAANPLLSDPYNLTAPRWVPAAGSPALGNVQPVLRVPAGTCLEQTCYRGAVPPSPADDWTTGWTYHNTAGGLGRTDIDTTKTLVTLAGVQASYTMKDTANYLISGKVEWPAGTTLTIDPGVVLLGDPTVLSYVVIQRGAQINALGTRTLPIVMTSGARWQDGLQAAGDWGGLVMNGRAIANCAACTTGASCLSEGDPTLPHCGNDDNDNSGTLRYVRVEYSGHVFSANNELNNFTWNSLGRGTTIEYCEAFDGLDDGFEWFGGTVSCKRLVAAKIDDDDFDWQMGFRGCVQFGVGIKHGSGDKAIEADNNEFNHDAIYRSNPVLSNMTLCGRGTNPGTGSNGIHLRRGTAGTIINSIVVGTKSSGSSAALDIDDSATYATGCGSALAVFVCPAILTGVEPVTAADPGFASRVTPNPVAHEARISFNLPVGGRTRVSIYDPAGRAVETVLDRQLPAGAHAVSWRVPQDAASGVYLYQIVSSGRVDTGRIVGIR